MRRHFPLDGPLLPPEQLSRADRGVQPAPPHHPDRYEIRNDRRRGWAGTVNTTHPGTRLGAPAGGQGATSPLDVLPGVLAVRWLRAPPVSPNRKKRFRQRSDRRR